ncbi:sensor histidine kinase [Pontibacter qinzhouensis]|nr:histidine kinase [Pontibacter qinzhouensis]
MIDKQKNYVRDLLLVALVTSVLFGAFSVLHALISSNLYFVGPPPPPQGMGGLGGPPMRGRPPMNIFTNVLVTTLMMLVLWGMNILLYSRFRSLQGAEKTKHIVRYVVSYAITFGLVALYIALLAQLVPDPRYGRALFFPLIAAFTNNTVVLIILDLVVLQRNKAQIELENTQLKMNSIQAQHQHLKHQLQPHFLFNSLNTLKTLIKRHPLEAEDYLIRLSEFLRASITADTQDTVPLKEELKLCVDYLEMQQVRFKNAFRYHIHIPDELMETGFVPVFSLQLLAENAIKHNGFTIEEPLQIDIAYTGDGYIMVQNNKKTKSLSEPSSGIGLKNLFARYKVLSDNEVLIADTADTFTVKIPILKK